MMNTIVDDLRKVPISERIQIVEDIWDSIAADSTEQLKLSPFERKELDRRYEEHQKNPSTAIPWEEVRAKLFKAE